MEFIAEEIAAYSAELSEPESALLQKINRETHLKVMKPRMLSGHLQGNLLRTFSRMMRPRRVLEIGTYTGYSALCLAEGLAPDGLLYTLDVNDELEKRVRGYFAESGRKDQIRYLLGPAADLIPDLEETFDLVFIDADKKNYSLYYDLIINKLRPGGLVLADNVLWSGKVCNPAAKDKDTEAIRAFNRKVAEDPRVSNTLLPVRDGIMMLVKN